MANTTRWQRVTGLYSRKVCGWKPNSGANRPVHGPWEWFYSAIRWTVRWTSCTTTVVLTSVWHPISSADPEVLRLTPGESEKERRRAAPCRLRQISSEKGHGRTARMCRGQVSPYTCQTGPKVLIPPTQAIALVTIVIRVAQTISVADSSADPKRLLKLLDST